jgi:hypothetical protein
MFTGMCTPASPRKKALLVSDISSTLNSHTYPGLHVDWSDSERTSASYPLQLVSKQYTDIFLLCQFGTRTGGHGSYKTNSSVHKINTRCKNNLCSPSGRLAAVQRGATYYAIKIFSKLLPRISGLTNYKKIFKSAFWNYSLKHVFYAMEEFLTNYKLYF